MATRLLLAAAALLAAAHGAQIVAKVRLCRCFCLAFCLKQFLLRSLLSPLSLSLSLFLSLFPRSLVVLRSPVRMQDGNIELQPDAGKDIVIIMDDGGTKSSKTLQDMWVAGARRRR